MSATLEQFVVANEPVYYYRPILDRPVVYCEAFIVLGN